MADIEILRDNAIIDSDTDLQQQRVDIQINEKVAILKGLDIRLENLKTIEEKKIKLQIDVLNKEIAFLKSKKINEV